MKPIRTQEHKSRVLGGTNYSRPRQGANKRTTTTEEEIEKETQHDSNSNNSKTSKEGKKEEEGGESTTIQHADDGIIVAQHIDSTGDDDGNKDDEYVYEYVYEDVEDANYYDPTLPGPGYVSRTTPRGQSLPASTTNHNSRRVATPGWSITNNNTNNNNTARRSVRAIPRNNNKIADHTPRSTTPVRAIQAGTGLRKSISCAPKPTTLQGEQQFVSPQYETLPYRTQVDPTIQSQQLHQQQYLIQQQQLQQQRLMQQQYIQQQYNHGQQQQQQQRRQQRATNSGLTGDVSLGGLVDMTSINEAARRFAQTNAYATEELMPHIGSALADMQATNVAIQEATEKASLALDRYRRLADQASSALTVAQVLGVITTLYMLLLLFERARRLRAT